MAWDDPLKVIIDTDKTARQAAEQVKLWDYLEVGALHPQARHELVWYEPHARAITIRPKQLRPDFYADTSVTRHTKAMWTLTDADWDEVEREADVYLISNGTDELIETNTTFEADVGFCLEGYLWGPGEDRFLALVLQFGQWDVGIYSDGYTEVYEYDELRGDGWLAPRGARSISERRFRIIITPTAKNRLLILRNDCGLVVTPKHGEEWPFVISSDTFRLSAPGGKIMVCLTQLDYSVGANEPFWLSPTRAMAQPPLAGQIVTVTDDSVVYGGGLTTQLYKPLAEGETLDDLVPYEPNGTDTEWCLGYLLNPNTSGSKAPWILGAAVSIAPDETADDEQTGNITGDVKSCRINVTDDALATTAELTIRAPDYWELEGLCNRRAVISIGDTVVLDGLFKEPPERSSADSAAQEARVTVYGLGAKMAEQPCLSSWPVFDGHKHTDVVRWLLEYAGVPSDMIETDSADWTLPITFKTGVQDSQLRPQIADPPREWVRRICEMTGWELYDGPGDDGNYSYRYLDPLGLSTESEHTFYVKTEDSAGPDQYDLIHSSITFKSVEPEGNEIHVIAGAEDGSLVDCVYVDHASQDPDLEPDDRPSNWLGFRKIVTVVFDCVLPEDLHKRVALRFGREIVRRCDLVEFEADWRPGLWRGSVVTLEFGEEILPWTGDYRITALDIECISEATTPPLRRAKYTAVRLADGLAEQPRPADDERLAYLLSYWVRFGPKRGTTRSPGESTAEAGGAISTLQFDQPPSRVIEVTDDDGYEEFVLGANGMDETVVVR